jgi:hypothetical protein
MSSHFWQVKRWVTAQTIYDSLDDCGLKILKTDDDAVARLLIDEEGNTVWCLGEGRERAVFVETAGFQGALIILKKICDFFKVGIESEHGLRIDKKSMADLRLIHTWFVERFPAVATVIERRKKEFHAL